MSNRKEKTDSEKRFLWLLVTFALNTKEMENITLKQVRAIYEGIWK